MTVTPENVPGWRRDLTDDLPVGKTETYIEGNREPLRLFVKDVLPSEEPKLKPGGLAPDGNYVLFTEGDNQTREQHDAKVREALEQEYAEDTE